MKKSLTGAVALLAGAFMAHSQGTVSFVNYGSGNAYLYVSLKSGSLTTPIGGATGGGGTSATADVGDGNQWTVSLLGAAGAGDAASALSPLLQEPVLPATVGLPVTATLAGGASANDPIAGTWYTTEYGVVPGGTTGGAATVQVAAWYNAGGTITSYAQALTVAGTPTGLSATANVTSLGGPEPTGPAATAAALPNVGNFNVTGVPEPSTIALGVMGASAFLLRLRKKP
jgi:hypothetical protein